MSRDNYGLKIREARLAAKKSVEDVANDLDILEDTYRKVEFSNFLGDKRLVQRIAEYFEISEISLGHDGNEKSIWTKSCYVGLQAFTIDHTDIFFGRDQVISDVVRRLDSRRKLVVLGRSGSGKSSLLAAGVAPYWKRRKDAMFAVCRPTQAPLAALSSAVISIANSDLSKVERLSEIRSLTNYLHEEEKYRAAGAIVDLISQYRDPLIIIDQFEELWSVKDASKIEKFLNILNALLDNNERHGPVFLFGCRTDAMGLLGQDDQLLRNLSDSLYVIPDMKRDDLQQAIKEPAKLGGKVIDDELTDYLTAFAEEDASSLPIIQFTLKRLWEETHGDSLSKTNLDDLGDISGLLADHIEFEVSQFVEVDEVALRAIALSLVDPTTYGADVPKRRRASREEFKSGVESEIIDRLVSSRVITADRDEQEEMVFLEVVHEIILRSWPRLSAWCDELEKFSETIDLILSAFGRWKRSLHDEKHLLNDELCLRLRHLTDFPKLGDGVVEFIEKSFELYQSKTREHWLGQFEVAIMGSGTDLIRVFNTSQYALAQRDINEILASISRGHRESIVRTRARLINSLQKPTNLLNLVDDLSIVGPVWLNSISPWIDQFNEWMLSLNISNLDISELKGMGLSFAILCPGADWVDHNAVARDFLAIPEELSAIERLQLLDRIIPFWASMATLFLDFQENLDFDIKSCLEHMATRNISILALLIGKVSSINTSRLTELVFEKGEGAKLAKELFVLSKSQEKLQPKEASLKSYAALCSNSPKVAYDILRISSDSDTYAGLISNTSLYGLNRPGSEDLLKHANGSREKSLAIALIGSSNRECKLDFKSIVEDFDESDISTELLSTLEWYCLKTNQIDAFYMWFNNEGEDSLFSNICFPFLIGGNVFKLCKIAAGPVTIGPQSAADNKIYFDSDHFYNTNISTDFLAMDRLVTVKVFNEFLRARGRPKHIEISHVSRYSDCPIVSVTWNEASEFCESINEQVDEGYFGESLKDWKCTLPTEAMWEHMCRVGSSSAFHFGDNEKFLNEYAWYSTNSQSVTWPAGLKLPNRNGLFDVHGNCWEWCSDIFGPYPKIDDALSDYSGPKEGSTRVLRGGCWNLDSNWCRSATRNGHSPENRNYYLSFRPVFIRKNQ